MVIEELIAGVRELANKYPDNIYDKIRRRLGCSYHLGDNTECPEQGCIFGIVLRKEYDINDTGTIRHQLPANRIAVSDKQADWCSMVQLKQDTKMCTWSQAVELADLIYPLENPN